ncbi:hypothetical protein [Hyunsoonleella ulvae]|uniref:hypothetical protein n=1 Tax=Hyunsoonleella ulvae TaxID=2799948 RepID=UPI001939753D|nr:hypothetical protein [Hyunsoonleella ulvae]
MYLKETFKNFTLVILLFFFVSCSTEEVDNNTLACNPGNIDFLQEGNSWSYQTFVFGFESATISLNVRGCNGNGFLVDRTISDPSTNENTTSTDLWREGDDFLLVDANGNTNAKIYKRNAQMGETWMHDQADGGIATHEVVSLDSTITVPAGTFKCVVYKYTATDIVNDSYVFWNDEVGNVKEDAGFFVLELTDYTVN